MLEVSELTKKYGKVLAADRVGFTVPDGKVGILLGPNGAGKSTVIKSIAGLLRYRGSVRIQGLDARTVEAKRRFAYVPEMPSMYDALTVREHMEFIMRAYGLEISEEEIRGLLDRFELTDKQDKLGSELSKGMMQKVSICCALIIRPDVILLDEPMVGLDPAAIKELKDVVLELRDRGCTVLISTHMLEMVKELWDVTFVMDKGRILGIYAREELADEDLEELFFSVTGQGGTAAGQSAANPSAEEAGEEV
ncbi:MAG: ABC transporter ATP-binding protein [Roseburia sp.]|nr:ABC transporter ATP-binding protein [Roseburia sp.]MCM1097200.1 ABC transporter ATP-binding protein [Ruminococcus flavefaciens]